MAAPAVPPDAVVAATGVTLLSFFTGIPPEITLGAFSGSVIFLLGNTSKPKWQWLLLFVVAFLAGILGAEPSAAIAGGLLSLVHISVNIPLGMGALASAACTINFVGWLRDNGAAKFFGKKKTEDAA